MASEWNCFRRKMKEEKFLVLFCNPHIVTLQVTLYVSNLLFQSSDFYPRYVSVICIWNNSKTTRMDKAQTRRDISLPPKETMNPVLAQ